jgi:signal peptidase I
MPRIARIVVRYGFWLGVAAVLWFAFAPVQIGGYDSYVITDGTSMLPTIHGGGLVITRQESNYHVGEIVAYHNAQLDNAVILHRIVKIQDGHYTFKGDNNAQADLYPPTISKLVGRKWFYWSSGGRFMQNLRVPYVGAAIIFALVLFAFAGDFTPSATSRRRRRHHAT